MKTNRTLGLLLGAGAFLGLALGGCGVVSTVKPVVVIASPPSGTQVDTNSELQVQANATDGQGVTRIDLLVNGSVVASESSPTPGGQPTFSAVLRWTPTTPGQQVVSVMAYNAKGDVSAPAAVNIVVQQAAGSAVANTTPAATGTPTNPAATAAPSTSDTPAPTATPQPAITVIIQQPPPPQPQPPQPQAPAKPSNFKPVGNGTTITFNWTDNSTNESGFRIYENGVTAPVITVPEHASTGGMSYDWTGQPCGFSASFYIRAYNNNGESGSSSTETGLTVPCVPANLIAQNSPSSVLLNWAVATPHDEAGFRIYEQGVPQPVATRGPNLGSGGTNFDWPSLGCNLFAWYFVRAYNSAGESGNSNLVLGETAPCVPGNLHETNATKLVVEFEFTDNATNETGFHVYRDSVLESTLPQHLASGNVDAAEVQQCGSTHVYTVRAFNPVGESNVSNNLTILSPAC